jgi:hypothetical protein
MNTKRLGSSAPATVTFQAALIHSSRSLAPTALFSGEPHPLESAAEGGPAHPQFSQCFEVLAPLAELDEGPLLEVGFQQSPGTLVYLRAFAWCFA